MSKLFFCVEEASEFLFSAIIVVCSPTSSYWLSHNAGGRLLQWWPKLDSNSLGGFPSANNYGVGL